MYECHQPQISAYGRLSAENFRTVYTFVLATIQQSLYQTPEIMRDVHVNGDDSRFLWGFKRDAYEWLEGNYRATWRVAETIHTEFADPDFRAAELVRYFAGLPGLGVVKGGFLAQLLYGLSGCLDTHNLQRFNLDNGWFKSSRFKAASAETQGDIVCDYIRLCDRLGGCEALWNSWCEYVASKQPERYASAHEVSAKHVEAIIQ